MNTNLQADSHSFIVVRGARTNNLKEISVAIPKRRITVFTGVSGSGKSSLVFGIIAAESQRLINETYTAFLQSFMPSLAIPEVDELSNLSAAIVVDQEPMGANSRSTVGTVTDASAMLRVIFSRLGTPPVRGASALSFNTPDGMCLACEGMGQVNSLDLTELFDDSLSLNDGAITVPNFQVGAWYWQIMADSGLYPADQPIKTFTEQQLADFLYKPVTKINIGTHNATYEGLVPKVQRTIMSKERDKAQKSVQAFMDRAATFAVCPNCNGSRLNQAAQECQVAGINIAQASEKQISDLYMWLNEQNLSEVGPIADKLIDLLKSLTRIGLGYLSLDRPSGTLSGGEAQRVKMVRHLGSALTDITYVFDEPTVGLHPHDIAQMNELLIELRNKGNTILVVEHKPEVIAVADHIIDLGPLAGSNGGQVMYEGDYAGLAASDTLTGRHFAQPVSLRNGGARPLGDHVTITGANQHNLKDVTVDVPLGGLVAVTGVAGSGKSSLIKSNMANAVQVHGAAPELVIVDQGAIRGSRRSNPATFSGLLDHIRSAFAKANGVKPGLFSANSVGACQTCNGVGLIYTDLAFMQGVSSVCEDCQGKRFTAEVLEYQLNGKNIHEVLSLSIDQAHKFFPTGKAHQILSHLVAVGLGYIKLGQALNTLSGGERQRLKLAINMGQGKKFYVLDEPTTGLHMADVDHLLGLLDQLVAQGNSVVVIEHNLRVVAHCDWVIDLGPGAGHDGGQVVFTGTPLELSTTKTTTGEHLRLFLKN